jgi:two-component system, OmpR family, response regulator VanR
VHTFQNLTILYIENDLEYRKKNVAIMHQNGLKVLETDNTTKANELLSHHKIDLILIDLNMHKKDRMGFIRLLRFNDIIAPIIITADDSDKEILLDAINLDTTRYLIKPLKKDELINALKIATKRLLAPLPLLLVENDLQNGFSYDPINKSVICPDGTDRQLSKNEYLLLELLLNNKRRVVSYEEIESVVWNGKTMSMDTLRTLVHALRKKTYSQMLINHSGIGYKFDLS